MRNMSFSATIEAMRAQTKTVTRRIDRKGYWLRVLDPGTLICAIEKGQGLAKGETVTRIGVIEIVDVRREPLCRLPRGNAGFPTPPVKLDDGSYEWHNGTPSPPNGPHTIGHIVNELAKEGVGGSEVTDSGDIVAVENEFGMLLWSEFIDLFCRINRCEPDVEVTRIEFKHRPDLSPCCGVELHRGKS